MRLMVVFFIVVIFLASLGIPSLKHVWHEQQKEKQLESDERQLIAKPAEDEKAKSIEKHAQQQEQKASNIHDEVLSYRLYSKERVRQIQMALQEAGYYKGEIDGKLGARTKRAVKEFQKAKKLNPDGIVGEKTWEILK